VYYFHDLPLKMERGCDDSLGTFGMFTLNADYRITQRLSQFYASQMINREWLESGGVHHVYPAASDINDGAGHVLVTAYAVLRPDGQWSIMMVNKDQHTSHRFRLVFADHKTGRSSYLSGSVHQAIFGSEQYAWHPAGRGFTAHLPIEDDTAEKLYTGGHADPDGPVLNKDISGAKDTEYELPPASIMVVRGKLSPE
jgi:hypothetical protein